MEQKSGDVPERIEPQLVNIGHLRLGALQKFDQKGAAETRKQATPGDRSPCSEKKGPRSQRDRGPFRYRFARR